MSTDEATRMREHYQKIRTFEQRMANPGFRRMFKERNDALIELLARLPMPLRSSRILDIGCGDGVICNLLHQLGAHRHLIVGADIQPQRVAKATASYPGLRFIEASGERLPFSDGQIDVVIAFTMFSSILNYGLSWRIAHELKRVLAEGGVVLWYDLRYPNPNNPNLQAMTLPRIKSLFPKFKLELKPMTLLPPLAERLGPGTELLYPALSMIPPLRSHYFGLLRKTGP